MISLQGRGVVYDYGLWLWLQQAGKVMVTFLTVD
jgi:hypothetical protein